MDLKQPLIKHYKAFNIAKNQKYDIRSAGVNTSGRVIKNKIMLNQISQL